MKLYGKRALTPRKAVKEVQINEKKYRIFEVFRYNQKKYAYAVEWNIPYTLQQKGIFFELSDFSLSFGILTHPLLSIHPGEGRTACANREQPPRYQHHCFDSKSWRLRS